MSPIYGADISGSLYDDVSAEALASGWAVQAKVGVGSLLGGQGRDDAGHSAGLLLGL